MRRTERAQWAWNAVEVVAKEMSQTKKSEYKSIVRKLPSLIQVSGLGQTLAFLYSRRGKQAKTAHGTLLWQLSKRLLPSTRQTTDNRRQATDNVMSYLVNMEPDAYRYATRKIMSDAEWLKRFAEGRLTESEQS